MQAHAAPQGTAPRTAHDDIALAFREAMRSLAASVAIISTRDAAGQPHGMVASSVIPVSMTPPSMLVAVNRTASIHPVLVASQRFCVNLLSDAQDELLPSFSQSALRDQRFRQADWRDAWSAEAEGMPWLDTALAALDCVVEQSVDYGTHTLFIGRVASIRACQVDVAPPLPMVWFAGHRAALARNV